MRQGVMVEMEHAGLIRWARNYRRLHGRCPSDAQVAKKIAEAHLKENPDYYKILRKVKL